MTMQWRIEKLGYIAQVIAGQSPPGTAFNQNGIGTPFYQGKKEYGERNLLPPAVWTTQETKIAEAGDLLISVRAPVGALNFATQRICIGRGIAAIRTSKLSPDFLFYALSNLSIKGKDGAVFASINRTEIEAIPIPVPPPSEQERIVGILDAAFEKIDAVKQNAERNLQNAKELFQQALSEAMTPKEGWKPTTLKDECFIASSLVNPQGGKYIDLLHIGGGNIESNTGKLQNLLTAEQEKLVSGKFLFDSSVVLYNKIRPYLRKLARPDFSGLCSADMYPLTPQAKNSRDFLFFLLLSDNFTNYANKNSARAGMPKLNRESLFAYPFVIPDSIEQQSIADELDKLFDINQQIQAQYDTISADCDELKKAILTKAFAGEL